MRILFCINPGAGPQKDIDWQELIDSHFQGGPVEPVCVMMGDDRGQAVPQAIRSGKPDRVVAVGGDGTVNFIATLLGGTDIPMGIIPAGSANGLATDLDLPKDPTQALDLIANAGPRPMDAILINEKDLCLHLSDLGLNARLIKYFDETEARGMHVYAWFSFKVLRNKARIKVRIRGEEGEILRAAFMVVIANARKYGTGATINKGGDLGDGFFEVILVRRFDLRELWNSLSERRRFDPRRIEVLRTREVEIVTKRSAHFQIDGDHKGRVHKVNARILKGHVNMIAPPGVL